MKTTPTLLAVALIGFIPAGDLFAQKNVTRRGPDVLYWMVRNAIGPTEGNAGVGGDFMAQQIQRGDKVTEKFEVRASGLEPNSTVSITVSPHDVSQVYVASVEPTDARGQMGARFLSKTTGRQNPRFEPVPDVASPASALGALCLENSAGDLIAAGGVFDAPVFRFVVGRNLTSEDPNGTAQGSMTLSANPKRTNFSLVAGGLEPSADYTLLVNSTPVGTITSTSAGRIRIKGWPDDAPPVLELESIALQAPDGSTALRTTFPQ